MSRTRFAVSLVILAIGCSPGDPMAIPEPEDMALVEDGALLDAVKTARTLVETNPEAPEAWAKLGHVYQAHEWEASAVECYRRATELEPKDYRWFYYLGRSLQTSDPGAAVVAYSRVTALNEAYAPAHLYLGYALRSLEKFDEAKRELKRLEELEPGNSFSELGLGELALAERDLESARRHLERALSRNPNQSAVHAALAKVYMAMGDKESARRHAASVAIRSQHQSIPDPLWEQVEMAGVTPKWLVFQGRHALREGDYETALLRFSSAVSADERDPRVWLDYGAALLGNQDYRRSIENLEKALALVEGDGGDGFSIPEGDLAMLYNNLGLAHEQLKELELAESHFLSAIRTSHPDSTERTMATNNLLAFLVRTGAAYEASNQLAAAASYFRKGLDLAPNSVLLLNNLAVVYRREARHTEAIELVKRSLEIQQDPRTLRMLDVLSQEAGVRER